MGTASQSPVDGFTWAELIYGAMESPSDWQRFLNAFADRLRASQAVLSVRFDDQPAVSIAAFVGATNDDLIEYSTKWRHRDPWMKDLEMQSFGSGEIRLSDQICPDEVLEQTEFYQQFLQPRNWHFGAGLVLYAGAAQAGILSFLRPKTLGPTSEEECTFLRAITPALSRAVRVYGELSQAKAELALHRSQANRPGVAFVLLNERGKVLMTNSNAEEILAKAEGLSLLHGRLQARDTGDHEKLMNAIAAMGAVSGSSGQEAMAISINRGPVLAPLIAVVSATKAGVHPRIGAAEPTACIHLLDPEVE